MNRAFTAVGRPTLAVLLLVGWLASPACAADRSPWTSLRQFFASVFTCGTDERCEFGDVMKLGKVEAGARDIVVPVKKKAWEARFGGEEAARPHVRARLAGWPTRVLADRAALPATDDAFLARLARDTWAGLEAFTDRENGLPIDNVHVGSASVAAADARIGDYTNITSVGLRLIAIVAAYEMEFLAEPAAVDKLRALLGTLQQLESYRGFFFNYYDTTSLERTSNFVSFVDSSWLTAGLMVVRSTFPQLVEPCTRLIEQADYRFFYDETRQLMSHGYYVSRGARSRYHYGVLYAESRLGSLIAIGKGEVPEAHWFKMVRTFPAACRWQTGTPQARERKTVRGYPCIGGYYEWQGLRYVPSWGGSLFEALMPTLVLDEARYAPESLGANDAAHAEIQRRYALEDLGYPVWGMSSSATPTGDGYREYGVPVLGSAGYKSGAVTPHAAALALSATPQPAIANLRRLAELYDIYGDYGFYDAVDPRTGAVAHTYLALDQAMLFIALANHMKDHCIQHRFAADPIAQVALPVIGDEKFFD